MLAELRETPAQVMQAELRVAPVREIRMAGEQRRLVEVNHLRPRSIGNNPAAGAVSARAGVYSATSERRSRR